MAPPPPPPPIPQNFSFQFQSALRTSIMIDAPAYTFYWDTYAGLPMCHEYTTVLYHPFFSGL